MKLFASRLFLLAPVVGVFALSACGGGDTDDRFDVADPAVRFVHASPLAPNVTLYRADIAQTDATNVSYKFASNYFDVSSSSALWAVKTAVGSIVVGEEQINPSRGNNTPSLRCHHPAQPTAFMSFGIPTINRLPATRPRSAS